MSRSKRGLKIKSWPLYSLLGVLLIMVVGGSVFIYLSPKNEPEVVSVPSPAIAPMPQTVSSTTDTTSVKWEDIYPNTKSMTIGSTTVEASVAQTWPERIKGLSGTPFLPEHVVKLFVFDAPGLHSIWMKEMNYSIDILWVSAEGDIVYLEEDASPESYPAMFVPTKPATYVIEAAAGFVQKEGIKIGDTVTLPKL